MSKLTQQKIADIFNVSQLMVSRWKQQGAPLDDFQALCKWLRLNRQRMPCGIVRELPRLCISSPFHIAHTA